MFQTFFVGIAVPAVIGRMRWAFSSAGIQSMVLTLMLSICKSMIFVTNHQLVIPLLTAAGWSSCREPGGVAPRAQLVRCVTKESAGSKIIRPTVEAQ
jgi:hypothetical protein